MGASQDNVILKVDKHSALTNESVKATWSCAFDPSRNDIACFVSGEPVNKETNKSFSVGDADIVFASYNEAISSRRALLTRSYIIFSRLQQYAAANTPPKDRSRIFADVPPPNVITEYNGISSLYRTTLKDHMFSLKRAEQIDMNELSLASSMLSIFYIAEIVHLPADGVGDAIVSEEVLDWVNQSDPAPSTSEGEELSNLEKPVEHPNFWTYVFTATLRGLTKAAAAMLETLEQHSNVQIAKFIPTIVDLLIALPRSTSYSLESNFEQAFYSWKRNLNKQRSKLSSISNDNDAVFEALYRLLAIMDGQREIILEETNDWKTALGAWGLFVQPELRRDNLPDVMLLIQETLPFDQTDPTETAQTALIRADLPKAVQAFDQLDPWLAAHLTDILDKVGIIEQPAHSSMSLREWFLLAYCDYIHSDPGLWRIAIDYLSHCGESGFSRMRQIIFHIPISIDAEDENDSAQDNKPQDNHDDLMDPDQVDPEIQSVVNASTEIAKFQDILKACEHFGLADEAIAICKIATETLCRQRRYGLALAFCYHIGNARRIAHIIESLMHEYVFNGSEEFKKLVREIPERLLDPTAASAAFSNGQLDNDGAMMDNGEDEWIISTAATRTAGQTACISRLSFLIKFREYLNLYGQGQLGDAATLLIELLAMAPRWFKCVLLLDCIPLLRDSNLSLCSEDVFEILRVLQEIVDPIVANNGRDIYGDLNALNNLISASSATSKENVNESLKQLDVLRYLASKSLSNSFQMEM